MLPSRRDIKEVVSPFTHKTSVARGVLRLSADFGVWLVLLAIICAPTPWWLKAACSALLAGWCARLFVLGHDACHGSFTDNSRANKVLGRIAFLPTLTAFSLWEIGHNVAHHGYNNLKTHDFVWTPLSAAEYAALSTPRRWLYRAYRSGWAPGLYYLLEIWWAKLFFPNARQMPTRRPTFIWDNVGATLFGLAWLGVLAFAHWMTGQSLAGLLLLGFALPFLVWCSIMGFVVYIQHTHPKVRWYDNKTAWGDDRAHLSATVHVVVPQWVNRFLHFILEHTAHHVDMSVPLQQLQVAQKTLETRFGDAVVCQPFSWRWYFQTARTCQLYDYGAHQWSTLSR